MKLNDLKQKPVDTEVFSLRLARSVKHNIDQIAQNNNSTPQEVIRYAVTNLVNTVINDQRFKKQDSRKYKKLYKAN